MPIARVMLLVCLSTVVIAGCGESLPSTVVGTITIDGAPLPENANTRGSVFFYPTGGGAAAFGQISSGGKYSLQTGGAKGLEPGEYLVTVSLVELPPEPPGGFLNAPNSQLISPPKYEDREQTDLKVNVEGGKNVIDLALKTP